MPRKSASAGGIPLGDVFPEKRRSSKTKKEKSKVQNAWLETLSKTREKVPLPSLHLRISLTDISRPWLGKWSQVRRGGNDHNIPVVRTKSQAGMLRPARLPTIYRSNARLFIDPFEEPVPIRNRPPPSPTECEKHSVVVNSPDPFAVQMTSPSPDKHSVTLEIHDGVEIMLSPRIEQVEHIPSRFEELSDDASVHELEAVYATAGSSAEDRRHSDTAVLCEANDPTALTTLEALQRSLTTCTNRQPRPKISLSVPRSKSFHIVSESGPVSTVLATSLPSPTSASLYQSLTKSHALHCSIISSVLLVNSPQPVRRHSSISVPLFMDASEFAHLAEEVPPLPTPSAAVAERLQALSSSKKPLLGQDSRAQWTTSKSNTSDDCQEVISNLDSSGIQQGPTGNRDNAAPADADAPADATDAAVDDDEEAIADHDDDSAAPAAVDVRVKVEDDDGSDLNGVENADADADAEEDTATDEDDNEDEVEEEEQEEDEYDDDGEGDDDGDDDGDENLVTDVSSSVTKKPVVESINKPLPPEPQPRFSTALAPFAYRPRLVRMSRSQEMLPRPRYSTTDRGNVGELKRHATANPSSLDRAFEELEWRLSSIRRQLPLSESRSLKTSASSVGGLTLRAPSGSARTVHQSPVSDISAAHRRRPGARSLSVSHSACHSRTSYEKKKSRSWDDLRSSRARLKNKALVMVEESETWYRTASERSSAVVSRSVFSEADTDGTCQTEQSQGLEKARDKGEAGSEKKDAIKRNELPQAMRASDISSDTAELIVLRIMLNLTTLKDLFSTAALNKGFYHMFKRHELDLIKTTVYKSSVPAWELRETSKERPVTPATYLRLYSVEIYTLGMLKSLVLVQCESFLRPTTIAGLVGTDDDESAAIDAAFWRVWTFCRLFGHDTGRDKDVEAQIDWLNGGQFARQRDPSTSFGAGNGEGLSKDEVYDMIEISTCLSVLMQAFHGRVEEARAVGIYAKCKLKTHRDEELLLEEWTWYIMTLGPSYILALAPGSFATAKDLGLTQWDPPALDEHSSHGKFFKDALTRVYKSRLAQERNTGGMKAKRSSKASSYRLTKSELAREMDQARQEAFRRELRFQRKNSPTKSEPTTFSDERPMSVYSQIVKNLPHGASRISAQDLALLPKAPTHFAASRATSTKSGYTTPRRPPTPVLTSCSAVPSADDDFPISPPECDRSPSPVITIAEAVQEHCLVIDPSDRALAHLINVLGFGREEAKWALKRSENGHGINVERAIDILVNGSSPTVSSRASSRQGESIGGRSSSPAPVEVESLVARPVLARQQNASDNDPRQRDSLVTNDEMTPKEKERANKMRMREKSYRVLGIASQPNQNLPKKHIPMIAKRFSRR